MSHGQSPLYRNEFCVVCRTTTRWHLEERGGVMVYVCSGGSKTLHQTTTLGCGKVVRADELHARHTRQ